MKVERIPILALCLALFVSTEIYAQTGSVSGTVTETATGTTLPGANVLIEELQKGASTDAEGKYILTDIPYGTYKVEVTFIGYKRSSQTVEINQPEVALDIKLEADLLSLQEIYVTALGFEATVMSREPQARILAGGK